MMNEPPAVLQLAGHPIRWRLMAELAQSDRMVSELTALVAEPQNLVSYHLAKLRGGGVVSARRSSADGRDTYYALALERLGGLLAQAGGALHPGLRGVAPELGGVAAPHARVLFLCTGNSARSQMAEALMRALSRGAVEAFSAGSQPKALHPNAVRAMAEDHGLDISGQAPKHLDAFAGEDFDLVVSLCDRVREACPDVGGARAVHWSLANPASDAPDAETYPVFRRTAAEIAERVRFLIHRLADEQKEARDGVRH